MNVIRSKFCFPWRSLIHTKFLKTNLWVCFMFLTLNIEHRFSSPFHDHSHSHTHTPPLPSSPLMVLLVFASAAHVHRRNILSTSVTLHVSRVSALATLWLMLSFCPLVASQLPENGSWAAPRHDLRVTNVSVPCGEEKRICHQP